ncbi:TetR/AcrR family transcriptional regulator [Amycolatopsis sp. H20-H5]|uniref:TetR/AcrR family transcriptional regulator n=1 Tax=Amycolatopsis sp. H20-H5 TaxID=3046309 RepID=UPI002DBD6A13|nr:TetR/AcrR family transcriptional regulator [Amycolatopsis sp. H20-H5]MEC3979775.1 TetR/AcrR family transcriptional regulator [Amycolatopsis sp. H20-H5]
MAKKRRLAPEDWADAALEALAEGGLAAVAVEPIATRLGATKGSFYWHFANRDALVQAALRRWAELHTETIITGLADVADPVRRLHELFGVVFGRDVGNRAEFELLAHANDPMVGPVLAEVTTRRVGFLVECFLEMGHPAAAARHRGVLAYTTYVGLVQAQRASGGELLPAADQAGYREFLRGVLAS